MSGTTKSISQYMGLALMFFGFIVCTMGFGNSVNASWGTSIAIQGISEMLFGISLIVFGNGLITLAKK